MEQAKQFLQTSIQYIKEKFQYFKSSYPRAYKGLRWLVYAGIVGLVILLLFVFSVAMGAFGKLPSQEALKNIKNHTASEVYSSDGVLLGKFYLENRTNVSIDEISPILLQTLIATEDARFYKHSGVDFYAMLRVFFKSILLRDESAGGGSTLSQQLSKNLFPRKKHSFLTMPVNKVKEMFVARRLEKLYTKKEILRIYLNTVPFSENIYGIDVATQRFFDTNPKDIKPEEAAVIIGMLKAPTTYNPRKNPDVALKRRNIVLDQLVEYEYFEKSVVDSIKSLPLYLKYNHESIDAGPATYFREKLRVELKEWVKNKKKEDGSAYNLYTDGLKIYTTIHSKIQNYAEAAVAEHMKKLQEDFDKHWKEGQPWNDKEIELAMKRSERYRILKKQGKSRKQILVNFNEKVSMTIFSWNKKQEEKVIMSPLDSIKYYYTRLNAGFVVLQPQTGRVLAWVGGTNHKYFKYDHVLSKRQVGSTFKPFVYASALKAGYQACDYFNNYLVTYTEYDDWTPENSDGKYGGLYSMGGALTKSVNSVAVDLITRVGIDSVVNLAYKMGIESEIPLVPSIALGSNEASLFEMVRSYGTFANRGFRPKTWYLSRIETEKGILIEDFTKRENEDIEEALPEEISDIMVELMQVVVDSGTAKRLRYKYNLGNDIAGKTGTTQSQADGWFIGYTPSLVAGAWVGADHPSVHFRSLNLGQGANTALPIWGVFMKKLLEDPVFKDMKYEKFPDYPEDLAWRLDCTPYIPEMQFVNYYPTEAPQPIIENDISSRIEQYYNTAPQHQEENIIDVIVNEKERRSEERRKKKEERRKKREERKKKAKKFFDKLFKKQN